MSHNCEVLHLWKNKISREGRIMITEFIMEHQCMSSILLFGLVSLLLQAMMVLSLKGYVRASANMKTTKKKIMLNLKNQFETIYDMGYQVRNTGAYVDKYLLKLKFMGFSYAAWEKAPFLAAGLVTLLAGAEAFYGYTVHTPMASQIEILFSYGVVLVCLFVFFHIFGVKSKQQQMQIQLVDYLENYLANRLLRTKDEVKILDEEMESAFMEGAARNPDLKKAILQEEKESEAPAAKESDEDMEMLRRLLREMESNKKDREKAEAQRETEKQIAASREKQTAEEMGAGIAGDSEIELLEEFVQSFLA